MRRTIGKKDEGRGEEWKIGGKKEKESGGRVEQKGILGERQWRMGWDEG